MGVPAIVKKPTLQELVFSMYDRGFRHDVIAVKLGITQGSSRVLLNKERKARGLYTSKPSVPVRAKRNIPLIPYAGKASHCDAWGQL